MFISKFSGIQLLSFINIIHNLCIFLGSYILMECDLKASSIDEVRETMLLDKDIIHNIFFSKTEDKVVCEETFDGEHLPPADRPSVQTMVEEGRRPPRFRKLFDPRTGLDYYPFHR